MREWTATTTIEARPEAVLDVLTDPEACARWAPIPFDVEDLRTPRLRCGSRARVSGRLAGKRVGFDVEVHEAIDGRLRLSADGPVGFDVRYDLAPAPRGSEVRASVCVRPVARTDRAPAGRGHQRPAGRRRPAGGDLAARPRGHRHLLSRAT